VFSTLTKAGSCDFVSEVSIPEAVANKKEYFLNEVYLKKKYRKISVLEAKRIQGFPDSYDLDVGYSTALGLLGNAVAVNVVQELGRKVINLIK
jgi:site-specific DNA-cytosine methylase